MDPYRITPVNLAPEPYGGTSANPTAAPPYGATPANPPAADEFPAYYPADSDGDGDGYAGGDVEAPNTNTVPAHRRGCCARIFATHTFEEISTSSFPCLPWWMLCATRALSSVALLVMGILLNIGYPFSGASFFVIFGLSATFFLLALSGVIYSTGKKFLSRVFPTTIGIFHCTFSVFCSFRVVDILARFALPSQRDWGGPVTPIEVVVALVPVLLYVVDVLVMQARVRLRYRYACMAFVLYFFMWTAFYFVLENSGKVRRKSTTAIAIWAAISVAYLITAQAVAAVSRFSCCCCMQVQRSNNNNELDE